MPRPSPTFSESWYRVADQNIRLRTGIKVRRQNFRGERWFVLENPFSNQFFRLRPAAWEFVSRLSRRTTVNAVWKQCIDLFPQDAPGQDEIIRLLAQLYHSNLLEYDIADDASQLFERFKKRRHKEVKARFLNIMFMRFPLLDPDRFLVKTLPLARKFLGRFGGALWILVVAGALKEALENWEALLNQGQSVLAPHNLLLLYAGLAITKTLHEFGHAYFCRKFGGEVHVMGIMLLIFTPIPYMDATSSWGFRSKWQRILVGAAGMIVEVFVAAIAVFIWARTAPGTLHNLAYNMIFVASVSTVLFNANPLLRFDGYYILSDLLEIPNLHQQAASQLKYFFKRHVYGMKAQRRPTESRKQAFWLTLFGIASNIYRIVVFTGIILFVADRFLLLGLLMAMICLTGWIVVPLIKFAHYLASSPELDRHRPRALAATAVVCGGIFCFLQFVPFPLHFRAPGILQAQERTQVALRAPGYLDEILTPGGETVSAGQPLVRLHNHELDIELAAATAKREEIEARLLQAMRAETANLEPLRKMRDAVEERVAKAQSDIEFLTVRSTQDGVWTAPSLLEAKGRWLSRGTPIGLVLDPSGFEFTATVVQDDVDRLFTVDISRSQVRVPGQAGVVIPIGRLNIIPAEQRVLPSPVLGWSGGGEIQTDVRDPEGRRAAQPFFEVRAEVLDNGGEVLLHGRSGKIRFRIGSQPLLPRWIREFRQLLQKRYQL